jgi:N-acetylglutamate synthase/N-acetylornithine aminotransferase
VTLPTSPSSLDDLQAKAAAVHEALPWIEIRTSDLTPEYVRLNSEYTT